MRNKSFYCISLVFSFFLIILFSGTVYSIPQFSNYSITIDSGDFEIDFINENYIIYSNIIQNVSKNYDRILYYVFDFTKEERRSFGRYSKESIFHQYDEERVFIIETYKTNIRNNSLADYTIKLYLKDFVTNNQQTLIDLSPINLTHNFESFSSGRNNTFLFSVLTQEFLEFDNDTKLYVSEGDILSYYKISNNLSIEQIDKISFNRLKEGRFLFENSKFLVKENEIINKENSKRYQVKLSDNQVCGISDNFLYYISNLYYEDASKPLYTLVKYDFKNNIEQKIILKDYRCSPGDLSFYAKPYIFDLTTDTFNYLDTENNKIQVLNEKILFLDNELNFIYLDLEKKPDKQVNLDNSPYENLSTNSSSIPVILNEETESKSSIKGYSDILTSPVKKQIEYIESDGGTSGSYDFFTRRNIVISIIVFEVLIVIFSLMYYFFSYRNKDSYSNSVVYERPKKINYSSKPRRRTVPSNRPSKFRDIKLFNIDSIFNNKLERTSIYDIKDYKSNYLSRKIRKGFNFFKK